MISITVNCNYFWVTKTILKLMVISENGVTLTCRSRKSFIKKYGGRGGIRTPGTIARSMLFESTPFDHSGTLPVGRVFCPNLPFVQAIWLRKADLIWRLHSVKRSFAADGDSFPRD